MITTLPLLKNLKQLQTEIKDMDIESGKSKGVGFVAIVIAFLAISIPMMKELAGLTDNIR